MKLVLSVSSKVFKVWWLSLCQGKEWLKQRLRFVQKNPKVEGSSAHQRYERYKKVRELSDIAFCATDLPRISFQDILVFM